MRTLLNVIFAPGFFQSSEVFNALVLGTVVAVISGVVGVFAVIRGQSFAGHALADFGATGASGAFLIGVNALWGFLSVGILGGAGMDLLGKRPRERDVATGIILSFMLGIGALFLYFTTTEKNISGAPITILFGSIFLVDARMIPIIVILGIITLLVVLFLYRPLILSSIHPDLARSRGVNVRLLSMLFMSALAMTVEQSAIVIGALLSTALLIGPAATAIRLTSSISHAIVLSVFIGLTVTWGGILLAYDSYYFPPVGRGWPVSFFVASLILVFYMLAQLYTAKNIRKKDMIAKESS
ncbi:metal ABC transporter permease [Sulfoacidibacillus ferrooxidans]|uniref:High-affinity zinc uptake system membrane protein ZnuB n=1 Tax=Sulfoacidibacillus ferrooxidans TaxID=2005001 RepID=A0A9X1VA46_9BACL|nr:High-affinity zinc uptake system membrane protein ZnuB [Sulfoacidibacillus ferrooxidans]